MEMLIDDSSPQILYISDSDGWSNGLSQVLGEQGLIPDPFAKLYTGGTFHATSSDGDHMVFRFNGTGIALYGARRPNHQVCGVRIDKEEEVYISGYTETPEFQRLLFGRDDLSRDEAHTITVTNYPSKRASNSDTPQNSSSTGRWLDIDHLIVTQPVAGTVYTTILDDTAAAFSYDTGWAAVSNEDGEGNSYRASLHSATRGGAVVNLRFNGTSVQLYGSVGPSHGNYSISLDNGPEHRFNATNWETLDRVALYTSSGLAEGQHTLRLVNRATNSSSGQLTGLNVDYAVINSTDPPNAPQGATVYTTTLSSPEATGSSSGPDPAPTGDTNFNSTQQGGSGERTGTNSSSNAGVIAGSVVSVVVSTLIILFLVWFVQRRKARKKPKVKVLRVRFPSLPPTPPAKSDKPLPRRNDYYSHHANVSPRSQHTSTDSDAEQGEVKALPIPRTETGSKFHETGLDPETESTTSSSSGSGSTSISAPLLILNATKPVPPSPAAKSVSAASPEDRLFLLRTAPTDTSQPRPKPRPRSRPTPRPLQSGLYSMTSSLSEWIYENGGGSVTSSNFSFMMSPAAASSCHPEDACQPSPATSDSSSPSPFRRINAHAPPTTARGAGQSAPTSNTPIFDRFSATLRSSIKPPPLVITRDRERHQYEPNPSSTLGRSHPYASLSPTAQNHSHSQSDDESRPRSGKRLSRLRTRPSNRARGGKAGLLGAGRGGGGGLKRTSTKSTPPPSWARHKKLQLGAAEDESGTM